MLCEPTQGLDLPTRHQIYALIHRLKAAGAGILLLSSDPEDLFAVCDRSGVVSDGVISGLWSTAEISTDELAQLL